MFHLVDELSRFALFLNQRPQVDQLIHRLSSDFLLTFKPISLAIFSLKSPNKLHLQFETGNEGSLPNNLFNSEGSIELETLNHAFPNKNLVSSLISQGVTLWPKDLSLILSGITDGLILSGILTCKLENAPSEEEKDSFTPFFLLSSAYLFPKISDPISNHSGNNHGTNSLTPRQRQVLAGFIEGKTNHELALELGFSISTIRHETMAIFRALGVSDRKEAAKIAQQNSLV